MNNRKRHVVDQALSLFIEKGIHQTSIQDILERAGISKGTFYNYFTSKYECVEAILEVARYETAMMRAELMIGKSVTDVEVLVEQITVLSHNTRARGLDVVLEEILHSGDRELRRVVMQHRMLELEWLAERFVEVYELKCHSMAFEAAIIFYGIFQNILLTMKLIHQNVFDLKQTVSVHLLYVEQILHTMQKQETTLLDGRKVELFAASLRQLEYNVTEVIEQLTKFVAGDRLTKAQRDVAQALLSELERKEPRLVVVDALLTGFSTQFQQTEHTAAAREISSAVWYVVKQSSEKERGK